MNGPDGPNGIGDVDDVALKLLHTADWHLGLRFPSFDDEDQLKLTRARLEAIERVLDVAEQYDVDACLAAGDLFDDPQPTQEWWGGLARLLSRRRGWTRPLFLLPGNHDPLLPESVWDSEHPFRKALPAWAHVVDRDDYSFELGPDACLYAVPCRSQAGERDLALELPDREPGDERLRIGLVHGQTFDIEGCQTNFPIARDAGARRGLDYLAIGDTHGFRDVTPDAPVPTVYPGAPEPTTFGERDAGNVALVFFGRRRRRPLIRPERVARFSWEERVIEDLATLRRLRDEDLRRTVLRLVLRLRVSPAEQDEVEEILLGLAGTSSRHGQAAVLQVDRDALRLDVSDLGDALDGMPAVLAETAARLQAASGVEGEEGEVAQRALYHLYRLVRSD